MGYMAEEVFPVPIVPVIKRFWYNPFSGIMISSPVERELPIISFRVSLQTGLFWLIGGLDLIWMNCFERKKLDKNAVDTSIVAMYPSLRMPHVGSDSSIL